MEIAKRDRFCDEYFVERPPKVNKTEKEAEKPISISESNDQKNYKIAKSRKYITGKKQELTESAVANQQH